MQKNYVAGRWVALLFALACAIALPTALYAAEAKETAVEPGVLVVAVDPNGPAASAGVKRGDIILAVDGKTVNSLTELMTLLTTMPPATTVTLQIQHGDEVQDVTVTTAVREERAYLGILPYAEPALDVVTSAPFTPSFPPVEQPAPLPAVPPLPATPAVTATTVTAAPALTILEVMKGSAAAAAGLQPYDMITAVDGNAVIEPDALRAHLASLQPGDTITLTITRAEEAPRDVLVKVGKGTTGQALLGVKLGVVVRTTVTSQGEAQHAVPAVPAVPHVEQEFRRFREARPFYRWRLSMPGCMIDSGDVEQGQPGQRFMQLQPDVLMIAPLGTGQWVAQPTMPAEQPSVVVVQGQWAQQFSPMAEPVQPGMVFVAPAQPMAVPMQSVVPDAQGNVMILNGQASRAQPAIPVGPAAGDYY